MGCLIYILYTKSASEKDSGAFFIPKYYDFFRTSVIVETGTDKEKVFYRMYVRSPLNRTSDFLNNVLQHDRNIEKVKIIS